MKGDMLVEDGIIREIMDVTECAHAGVCDLKGRTVVPGFIDIHTHGGVGVDVNAANAHDYEKI